MFVLVWEMWIKLGYRVIAHIDEYVRVLPKLKVFSPEKLGAMNENKTGRNLNRLM